jgi:sugar phosphate isomerase/epimerase
MFGISTSWKSSKILDGDRLIDELEKTGIPGIELEYRITTRAFRQIKKRLQNNSFKVLSLHNYCPYPEILPIENASGDGFRLSSIDEDERKQAIKYSLRTVRNAAELSAKAVVFHLGQVGVDREAERWFSLFETGKIRDKEGQEFFQRKLREREQAKQPYLDAVLHSLNQLNKEADKLNILIGAETRYHWDQLPNYNEIRLILDRFKGGKIGYWHDVGHAQANETFGLCKHEDFLKAYSKQMIGIHLHDAQNIGYNDHFAPGSGLIDFDMIKKYLSDNTIRIIEAHPKVNADELEQGVRFLKEKGIIDAH